MQKERCNWGRARHVQGTVKIVWLKQWFSTQIVPTAGGVPEIWGGGFGCHMIRGAGLYLGGQRLMMLVVL